MVAHNIHGHSRCIRPCYFHKDQIQPKVLLEKKKLGGKGENKLTGQSGGKINAVTVNKNKIQLIMKFFCV